MPRPLASPSPIPPNEADRQREVDALPARPARMADLDQIATAAALALRTPSAMVTVVDGDRMEMPGWYNCGLRDVPRAQSICAHAIMAPDDVLCVPDATIDERFRNLAVTHGEHRIGYYLGAPIRSRSGQALGMLCVMDGEARAEGSAEERRALKRLAKAAARILAGAGGDTAEIP